MKATFSEQYYREHWDEFLKPVIGEHFVDMFGELKRVMEDYKSYGMPELALPIVEKMEAEKIALRVKELVYDEMRVVRGLKNGTCSLGYTTQLQEIRARAEYVKRFEFNCLQFRDFCKAYKINKG